MAALALIAGIFTACENDNNDIVNPDPKDQWGKTMRGDNQTVKGYPDIFANYWEYTYSYKDNPNIGLRLSGRFPMARFFNFTVYNDKTEVDVSSIEDSNIKPESGSINPYIEATDKYGDNEYVVYVIPKSTPASLRTSMKNICEFPDNLEMVSVFLRLYLAEQYSKHESGGVDLPAIQAFDVTTGKDVEFPKHEKCNIYEGAILPPMDFSSDAKPLPFMRPPLNLLYPNTPAEYLFTRIKLSEGQVATFRFIPPTAPKSVSEYTTADVRYWSICLGGSDALSYKSAYDNEMPKRDSEGYVTIIIADQNSAKLSDIQKKAEKNEGTYLMTWNRKEWKDGVLALYRNMVIRKGYEHSMREQMVSIDQENLNPQTMIAMLAMGPWGPQGYKFSEDEFLSDSFDYGNIRKMR